jgi:hypothetical protein
MLRHAASVFALLALVACDQGQPAQAQAGSSKISTEALCRHFVGISAEQEGDQVAKRDRNEDLNECMATFPAMESQLKGEEKANFRACAMEAADLAGFTACAPSLFKPAKPAG